MADAPRRGTMGNPATGTMHMVLERDREAFEKRGFTGWQPMDPPTPAPAPAPEEPAVSEPVETGGVPEAPSVPPVIVPTGAAEASEPAGDDARPKRKPLPKG